MVLPISMGLMGPVNPGSNKVPLLIGASRTSDSSDFICSYFPVESGRFSKCITSLTPFEKASPLGSVPYGVNGRRRGVPSEICFRVTFAGSSMYGTLFMASSPKSNVLGGRSEVAVSVAGGGGFAGGGGGGGFARGGGGGQDGGGGGGAIKEGSVASGSTIDRSGAGGSLNPGYSIILRASYFWRTVSTSPSLSSEWATASPFDPNSCSPECVILASSSHPGG
uniref:Uncharacterized protein n=1 Tax=Anopheles dirus TaxID=7168 RepID=A0A182NLY5_9DIPT